MSFAAGMSHEPLEFGLFRKWPTRLVTLRALQGRHRSPIMWTKGRAVQLSCTRGPVAMCARPLLARRVEEGWTFTPLLPSPC